LSAKGGPASGGEVGRRQTEGGKLVIYMPIYTLHGKVIVSAVVAVVLLIAGATILYGIVSYELKLGS
jgi:hypothetical protein